MVRRGGKKVGVTDLPRVMVDSFLRDYLEIDFVVGRELKVCSGYFVGLMEEKKKKKIVLDEVLEDDNTSSKIIGIGSSFNISLDHQLFSLCKVRLLSHHDYIIIYWSPNICIFLSELY